MRIVVAALVIAETTWVVVVKAYRWPLMAGDGACSAAVRVHLADGPRRGRHPTRMAAHQPAGAAAHHACNISTSARRACRRMRPLKKEGGVESVASTSYYIGLSCARHWRAAQVFVRETTIQQPATRHPVQSVGHCRARDPDSTSEWLFLGLLIAYHVGILAFGNWMAFRMRNIASTFSESKWEVYRSVSYWTRSEASRVQIHVGGSAPIRP